MNLDNLIKLLKEKKLYKDNKNKNIIAICPICGDHPNPRKKGHLYISKEQERPIYHCFYGNCTGNIRKLVKYITKNENVIDSIITREEVKNLFKNSKKIEYKKEIKLEKKEQDIKKDEKYEYLNKRLFYQLNKFDINKLNVIFNIKDFIEKNKYSLDQTYLEQNQKYLDFLNENCINFLTKHNSLLICRSINDKSFIKYYKFQLYNYNVFLLDYYCYENDQVKDKNLIVMAEGVFDILAYLSFDKLNLKEKAFLFVSCLSTSYISVLKSVCYDYSIYSNLNVIILSDRDKNINYYKYKFINQARNVIKSLKIYINKGKKDFGCFPNEPILLYKS